MKVASRVRSRDSKRVAVAFLVVVAGLVLGFVLATWAFLVYPVHIMVLSDPASRGTQIYVDGVHSLTISGKGDVLHLRRGWHVIEARKNGCTSTSVRFRAQDWEQGSTTSFSLSCRRRPGGNVLVLKIE